MRTKFVATAYFLLHSKLLAFCLKNAQ